MVFFYEFAGRFFGDALKHPVESNHIVETGLISYCGDAFKIHGGKFFTGLVDPYFV
jgi:hypothetical protein